MNLKVAGASALATVVAFVALLVPVSTQACGCGSWDGPTIASGTSPGEVDWRIYVVRHSSRSFSLMFDAKWTTNRKASSTGVGLTVAPGSRIPPIRAVAGGDLGPKRENDVSGLANWRAKKIVVTMRSGKTVSFKPVAAPAKLREKWPWLNGYRFFDQYFPRKQKPIRIAAFSESGKRLARHEL